MKKALLCVATLGIFGTSAWAQSVVSVKVGLTLPGANFFVDGQSYNTQQVFLWPVGSKHIVQFPLSINPQTGELPYQYANGLVARWSFGGWADNLGLTTPSSSLTQTVTAFPGLTSVIGRVTIEHLLRIQFSNAPPYQTANLPTTSACGATLAPGNPPQDVLRYGIVYLDGTCYDTATDVYVAAGVHTFNAFPYPGYVFAGWLVPGPQPPEYLLRYNITSAMTVGPNFQPAKRVAFRTDPYGLTVYVDHSLISTPPSPPASVLPPSNYDPYCDPDYTRLPFNAPVGVKPLCTGQFDFLPGSVHQIAAPVSQQDRAGKYWVFKSFSNGQGQNSNYVTDNRLDLVDTVTANFVPGVLSTIITNPTGLQLSVDGRTNWPSYNFIWGEGEKHTVNAAATQVDARGRKWQFTGWSDKGDPTHDLTVPVGAQGLSIAANYQLLGQVQVTSNPTGLTFQVDGAACTTPCKFDKASGSTLAISVPASIPASDLSRFDFDGFSVGGTGTTRTITFTQDAQTITANYHASYLLVTGTDPTGAATFDFQPSSSDSYFADGTQVQVTVLPKGGYKFRRWDGDLSGIFTSGYLTMSSPHVVRAILDKVPFIPPAGVKNAAGETPDGSVAPGSIISIYGDNLAAALEIGPRNPLAQTIGGVTVSIEDRVLPLMFVSPQQINAQVFSDLADGDYTLTVRRLGQADVVGKFTIHRNAPGLYTTTNQDGTSQVLATHEDGSPVTGDSPAHAGETITVFGTGFGPYDHKVIDGFVIPDTDTWKVADPVSVNAGAATLQPQFAGAASGMVGTTIVQVKLSGDVKSGAPVDFTVTVNGKLSNASHLPVE